MADNNDPKVEYAWGLYQKTTQGLTFIEIAAAAFGHEIEHTTKENILTVDKSGKPAAEKDATKISDQIINETNEQKKKK